MTTMITVGEEEVSVDHFYAALYWGFVVSTALVGISVVQGYLYFTTNNKDRWSIKALVVSVLILDPATSLLMAQTIYYYFIVNFGVAKALEDVPISWVVENELTVLVAALVQIFLASRVHLVNSSVDALPLGRTAPALVLVFALVAFVAGSVRTVFIGIWSMPSFSEGSFRTLIMIGQSCSLASGLLSSVCLCYMLATPRLDSMKWSETLKALFMFTINRAILMSIIEIGLLCSYISAKNSLYWMPFHLCKSKLYTNTLLAMLNTRSGGGFQSQTPSIWSMPVINLTIEESGRSTFISEREVDKPSPPRETVASGSSTTKLPSPGSS
ncbi:hypothetical protein HD554DRAFT_2094667 [Boletus coccyginus]|nr:hypothetical protein HD554DRAFT_2094667 [Boletus coccyginus]